MKGYTKKQIKDARRRLPGGSRYKEARPHTLDEVAGDPAPAPVCALRDVAEAYVYQQGGNGPFWPVDDWKRLLKYEQRYWLSKTANADIAKAMPQYCEAQIRAKRSQARDRVAAPTERPDEEELEPQIPALEEAEPAAPHEPELPILPPALAEVEVAEGTAGLTAVNFVAAIRKGKDEITVFTGQTLHEIAVGPLPANSEDTVKEITTYVTDFFKTHKVDDKPKPKLGSQPKRSQGRRYRPMQAGRSIRRALNYKQAQALWLSDRSRLAQQVLDGKIREKCLIPMEEIEAVYKGRFGATSCEVDLSRYPKPPPADNSDLLFPISTEEVLRAGRQMKKDTASGPDDISLQTVQKVDRLGTARANLFNIWLLTGRIPSDLKKNRSILLPKGVDNLDEIGNWRPLTIASVLLRQYTAILAVRLTKAVHLNPRQRGFIKVQGCAENTNLVRLALEFSKKENKPIAVAFLDLAKAFDTVSHHHIIAALRRFEVHPHMVDVVVDLYTNTGTTFKIGLQTSGDIAITQGVKQGDPLSPLLFNIALDPLFCVIDAEGEAFSFGPGVSLGSVAYADDTATIAESRAGLQKNLDLTDEFCGVTKLEINVRKSAAFTRKPAGKSFLVNAHTTPLKIAGKDLPLVRPSDSSKYLGSRVSPWVGVVPYAPRKQLQEWIERISAARLKPRQKVILLIVYAVPKLRYALTVGTLSQGKLRGLDKQIRAAVRTWLKLPRSSSKPFCYVSARDGGLGLPNLEIEVQIGVFRGLVALTSSNDQTIVNIAALCNVNAKKAALMKRLNAVGVVNVKRWRGQQLKELKEQVVAGEGAACFTKCPISNHWLSHVTFMKEPEYISAVKLRAGVYPVRAALARGQTEMNRACRRCPDPCETACHVSSWCPAVKKARIQRHNKVVNFLCGAIKRVGWQVLVEPVIIGPDGNRYRPDLVAYGGHEVIIVDPTVVWDSSVEKLDAAFDRKVKKYTPLEETLMEITDKGGSSNLRAGDRRTRGVVQEERRGFRRPASEQCPAAPPKPVYTCCLRNLEGVPLPLRLILFGELVGYHLASLYHGQMAYRTWPWPNRPLESRAQVDYRWRCVTTTSTKVSI
jgi:hypothetical protein